METRQSDEEHADQEHEQANAGGEDAAGPEGEEAAEFGGGGMAGGVVDVDGLPDLVFGRAAAGA